jgi:hypothetical protein
MRYNPPTSKALGRHVSVTDRLITLGVLLCLGILMAASGPHLVHHLADRHPRSSHPHASQPTDCLVLSLMQHTPLAGDFIAPLLVLLSPAESANCAPCLQELIASRPIHQARSPPHIFSS